MPFLKNKLLCALLAPFFMFNDAPGGGGAPAPAPVPAPAPAPTPAPSGPETFSREYVSELRQENAGTRHKLKEAETAAEAARAAAKAAEEQAQAKITEAQAAADKRILMSELKAVALKAGMVDLDGLKLADLSSCKLNEAGELEGGDELMESLKKAKPYLFGTPGTSHPGGAPKPNRPGAKKATEMSADEYAAAKAAATRGGKK